MRAVDVLRTKRDGGELSAEQIAAFVHAASDGGWPQYQLSALLMAIVIRGMTDDETAALTQAMTDSGQRLDWSDLDRPAVDKHSTGGVGDKTSLILAPLAAACGCAVPMMSGRGLGHTGGTLDKLEAIPGFRVNLSLDEFRAIVREIGVGMIGQTAEIAPADKTLYALRDVTSTVESVPLITASILSKKIAEGVRGLVMDVKCGRGAFMKTREDSRTLAASIQRVGELNGVRTEAIITAMDAPLGTTVGNALEVAECVRVLRGEAPGELEDLSVLLAASMVKLGGLAPSLEQAEMRVRAALASGAGLEVFRQIIERQGGDVRVVDDVSRLPPAPERILVRAPRSGWLTRMDAEMIGVACVLLGAGRERAEDAVDPAVGAVLHASVGQFVEEGEPVVELHVRPGGRAAQAEAMVQQSLGFADEVPPPTWRVLGTIRG